MRTVGRELRADDHGADPVMRFDTETALLQRADGRSRGRLPAADAFGSPRPQWHGDDEPGARRAGRPADPPARRQRDRCGSGCCRRDLARRADEHQRGVRRLRRDLHREREQAPLPECQRLRAHGCDAPALQLPRLLLEPDELRVRLRHAGRHPLGHRARRRVGLGRNAGQVRQAHLQGDAAARDRLRHERRADPGARGELPDAQRVGAQSGVARGLLHAAGS